MNDPSLAFTGPHLPSPPPGTAPYAGDTARLRDWSQDDADEMTARREANRLSWYCGHRPTRYAAASLDQLHGQEQDPDRKVTGWLRSPSPSLLMWGDVGRGKTHAAYAVTNAALDAGLWVVAVAVVDLLDELRPGPSDRATVADRARRADVLLLDDLGSERTTDWTVEQLGAIIDARVREERRTIVTTNLGRDEMWEREGQRIMSRLEGGAHIARITGPDRRAAW